MRVTTRDIAKEAGVSQTTVSLVLNNNTNISISSETRAHVIKVAERMGYIPRKRVAQRGDVQTVGLLVPSLSNMYYPSLIQNVQQYAQTIGINLVVQNTLRSEVGEVQSFRYLRSLGAKGILCLFSPKSPIPEDIPSVIIGEKLPGVEVDTVSLNSYAAGRMAAEHLLSLGHKKIAFISTPLSNITYARQRRLEGVRNCMTEAGLADELKVIIDDAENESVSDTYEFDCGVRLTEQLLRADTDCTAIVAVNDMTAMGCISALRRCGLRIPEDMAVCGFDNLWLHKLASPALTSVDQMAFYGCKVGLSVLMEKMNTPLSQSEPIFMEYEPQLHVRETTVKK